MEYKVLEGNLTVDKSLFELINKEILPATSISEESFWKSFESIIDELTPENKSLLKKEMLFRV